MYDAECHSMKRTVRHLESVFRRHHFARCHSEWRSAVVRYHSCLALSNGHSGVDASQKILAIVGRYGRRYLVIRSDVSLSLR